MIIEKKIVIEALRKEPLNTDRFFDDYDKPSKCEVCAVGAVVRRSIGKKINKISGDDLSIFCSSITRHKCYGQDIDTLLKEKNYLGALSNYFEDSASLWNGAGGVKSKEFREQMVAFVKKNFPTQFKVEDLA